MVQPQARAPVLARGVGVGLHEGVEDHPLLGGGNADARIGHAEEQRAGGFRGRFHRDAQRHAASVGEFDGVADQVVEHLREPGRVAP
jgi:hypothetical protein